MGTNPRRGEMLLAIFKYKHSLTRLQEGGWYHIPLRAAPKSFKSAGWLCFYQGKIFDKGAFRVEYYGEIDHYEEVPYRELFPNQLESEKSNWPYYRIYLKGLIKRPKPILSFRPRRLAFVPTTLEKFHAAEQINDLFNESPLEDLLWKEFKGLDIKAERQWLLPVKKQNYFLDFALFCKQGFLDIEADGDSWHAQKDRIRKDNKRNNALAQKGWQVLRYNSEQLLRTMKDCIEEVRATINTLGGLSEDGLIPRVFYQKGGQQAQQLSLFENRGEYTINKDYDSGADENLEFG